jgi:putative addiction module component (TIGR02574 family)
MHKRPYGGGKMNTDKIRDEIDRLELSEKLLLVEDIWDSIAASNSELPMPEWQKIELDSRYREYREGSVGLHDWKTVHEGLQDPEKRP